MTTAVGGQNLLSNLIWISSSRVKSSSWTANTLGVHEALFAHSNWYVKFCTFICWKPQEDGEWWWRKWEHQEGQRDRKREASRSHLQFSISSSQMQLNVVWRKSSRLGNSPEQTLETDAEDARCNKRSRGETFTIITSAFFMSDISHIFCMYFFNVFLDLFCLCDQIDMCVKADVVAFSYW